MRANTPEPSRTASRALPPGARGSAGALAVVAFAACALASCSGPARFIDKEADIPFYERVAIVPFSALGSDATSGQKVTAVFFVELLRASQFEVVEPGQFTAAMTRVRGGTPAGNPWSTAELAKLGEEAGVQGIFFGTVRDYEMERSGQEAFPVVSVDARFVDAATGRVVWSANRTRRGGPGIPLAGIIFGLFGGGEIHTLGEITSEVCRELIATLPGGR
ncbi:MAG: hypothetical protein ACKVU1_17270 [bacterium]